MLPKLEHYPVNWVDGMKISRRHFSDFEHFVSDHLRDAAAAGLTNYNYGLLPSDAPDFNLQVVTDQNQGLRVLLTNCRAITGAGCRIEIIGGQLELATSLTEILAKYNMPMADELQFLIVLSVDLFARQPEGIPANNEPFPRPPFSIPTYRLNVVPGYQYEAVANSREVGTDRTTYPSAAFESFHLVVGQLNCRYGQLVNDAAYIPACAAIGSHVRLTAWADRMSKLLSEVQSDSFKIADKVCEKRGSDLARKAGPLAELILNWVTQLANALDDVLNHLHYNGKEQPPHALLKTIALATRRAKTSLNCLNDKELRGSVKFGKDVVLDYFQKWTDISPNRLTTGFDAVINRPYNHSDIRPHLELVMQFWENIARITHKMTELEYIGQTPQQRGVLDDSRPTDERDAIKEDIITPPLRSSFSFRAE